MLCTYPSLASLLFAVLFNTVAAITCFLLLLTHSSNKRIREEYKEAWEKLKDSEKNVWDERNGRVD